MANLALCLKKSGVKLSSSKKKELMDNYNQLKDLGMSHKMAAYKSIEDLGRSLKEEKAKVESMMPTKSDTPIRLSKAGDWKKTITDPKAKEVFDNIGYKHVEKEKTYDRTHMNWWDRFIMWVADDLHALKVLEETGSISEAMSGYKAHRMLTSFPTMFKQFLETGSPVYDKEDLWMKFNNDGGLFNTLRKLKPGELEPFFNRFLGLSARELQGKKRKDLFGEQLKDDETIQILLDHTEDVYQQNKKVWDEVTKDLRNINNNFLDFIEAAGLIDGKSRKDWQRDFYVPFTRMITDFHKGEMKTLHNQSGGKDIKQVIRRLSGGKSGLGDPMLNLVNNYSFMMHEALRNMARKKSLNIMMQMDLAEMVHKKAKGTNVLTIFVKGKPQKIKVHDAMLASTLIGLEADSGGRMSKWLTHPRKWLTWAVTVMPAFRVANWVRDTAHVALIERSFIPVWDSMTGFVKAMANSKEMKEFAATGGSFAGAYHTRDIGKHGEKAFGKLIKDIHPDAWTNPAGFFKNAYSFWERIGEASENAARLGLYSRHRKKGATKLEAGFRAKDLLDFNQSGSSKVLGHLLRTVPFLNARIQGLYKVGRAGVDPRTRNAMYLKLAAVAFMSFWLAARNEDDERYKELPDHERLMYLHFFDVPKVGHLRIPLPFELGAFFSAWPSYLYQWLGSGSIDSKRIGKILKDTAMDTFRLDFPQYMKPLLQQRENRNFFTGAPIETRGEQARESQERYNARSSDFAKALGGFTGKHTPISPKRIDAFIQDVFSSFGRAAVLGVDKAIMPWITSFPVDPAVRVGDRYISGIGRFVKGDDVPYRVKSEETFYKLLKEADEASSTLNYYIKFGMTKKARALVERRRGVISANPTLKDMQEKVRSIGNRMNIISYSTRYTAEEKRQELDYLIEKRNKIFHKVVSALREKGIK